MPERGIVLRVQLRFIRGQLAVRADEYRHVRQFGLIDEADVGEIGRDGRRRHQRRQQQRCERKNGKGSNAHSFL